MTGGGDRNRAPSASQPGVDVAAELEHHIAMRIQDNVAAGMSPDAARQEALRRFGDVAEFERRTRRIDERMARGHRRAERFDRAGRSLLQAVRTLARRPFFALVAVLTLALGQGATVAIWTLLDDVVLRPLPYSEAERLVAITHPVPGLIADGAWGLSFAGYFHFRDHGRSLANLGVFVPWGATLSMDGEPERVQAVLTTATLLGVLGARPLHGRLLTEADDAPPGEAVAVLGHAFWLRRHGGDPSVVGRTIEVGDRNVEVVGVLTPGFELPRRTVDLWMPLGLDRSRRAENAHGFEAIGRLSADVSPPAARAELRGLVAQFTDAFPEAYSEAFMRESRFDVAVTPLRDDLVAGIRPVLWTLLGSVGLVLLIAWANVANLFLVRAEATRRESAIRSALGAGRRELAWHHLTESMLVATFAGGLGLLLAYSGLRLLVALAPPGIPRLAAVGVGGSSVAVMFGLSLVAGLVFGLIPLVRGGSDPGELREGGRSMTASGRTRAARGSLVVAQVALALVLLAGAGLMLRSFRNLSRVDPGVDPAGVLAFEVSLSGSRYATHEAVNAFYRNLTEALARQPGVTVAGATTWLPAAGSGGCSNVYIENQPLAHDEAAPCLTVGKTTPGLGESLGMRVHGRTPSWSEDRGTGTALVTRAFANRFWPDEDALGKGVRVWGAGEPYYRVVGVIEGLRADLDGPPVEAVFLPMLPLEGAPLWQPSRWANILVATDDDRPETYLPLVKNVVADLDPGIPLANVRSMRSVISGGMAGQSFPLVLLGVAAAMSLVLSAVGLYGVVAYSVGQRTGEIGIRMALGARAGQVGVLVVRQALVLVAAGIAIGLPATFAATRALRSLLFEVDPSDPLVLGAVAVLLALIALAASWVPAIRASRVDPLVSLRAE